MSDKITITTEKDGRIIVFEGSGTLTLIERVGGWVDTRPTSLSREVRGVEVEWDGDYTIREADREHNTLEELEAAREELVDLRQENDRLERILQSPLTLRALEAAWAAAEEHTPEAPIREGDMLIERFGPDAYHVYLAEGNYSRLPCAIRILSRAPREPWADLADVLRGTVWERLSGDVDGLAAAVHAAGWRKGGDGDERVHADCG